MSKDKLRIVLDTNIFMVSIASHHQYSWIYDALMAEKFELCVSNEIIAEYEEKIGERYGLTITEIVLEGVLQLPNVVFIDPHYNWPILSDPDDNKFIDCAVAGNVDFIVSNDKVFKKVDTLDFPPLVWYRYEEFEGKFKDLILNE